MKILIIGSEGFIGKHCATYFKKKGHEVFGADIIPAKRKDYTSLNHTNTDFGKVFSARKFDLCINASGSANVNFSFENPTQDFELNVVNVHKMLVSIRKHNPSCKYINFSSAAVYGNPTALPISEQKDLAPVSPYGFHKLQSEYLLREYHNFFGIRTCSLRVFSAYGPGLKKQLFWDLFQKTTNKKVVTLFGSGNESRDFIYIDDLVQAIEHIIKRAPFRGESINIASGKEIKIKEASTALLEKLDYKGKLLFSGRIKTGDPQNWRADISTLKSFGFKPSYSLQKGLTQYANWLSELK